LWQAKTSSRIDVFTDGITVPPVNELGEVGYLDPILSVSFSVSVAVVTRSFIVVGFYSVCGLQKQCDLLWIRNCRWWL